MDKMQPIAAVYLEDTEYGVKFKDYLKQQRETFYHLVFFNEQTSLEQYLSRQNVALLVMHDTVILNQELYEQIDRIVYLSSEQGPRADQKENDKIATWYQYQSMKQFLNILAPLPEQINQNNSTNSIEMRSSEIISILAIEDVFHSDTSVYLLASQIKAEGSVLVVDLTQFGSISDYFSEKSALLIGDYTLSDLIYYAKEREQNVNIEGIFKKNKSIYYIPSMNFGVDLIEIGQEDISVLVQMLMEGNTRIIFIISVLTEATAELLRRSDHLIYLGSDRVPEQVQKKIRKQLEQIVSTAQMKQMKVVMLSEERELVKQMKGLDL